MSATESGSSQQENEDTIEQGVTPLDPGFGILALRTLVALTSMRR